MPSVPTPSSTTSLLASVQDQVLTQQAFISAMPDPSASEVSPSAAAKTNVTSIKLQALQAQRRRSIKSLAAVNVKSTLILKLYGRRQPWCDLKGDRGRPSPR